jgi:hypothetical protein
MNHDRKTEHRLAQLALAIIFIVIVTGSSSIGETDGCATSLLSAESLGDGSPARLRPRRLDVLVSRSAEWLIDNPGDRGGR